MHLAARNPKGPGVYVLVTLVLAAYIEIVSPQTDTSSLCLHSEAGLLSCGVESTATGSAAHWPCLHIAAAGLQQPQTNFTQLPMQESLQFMDRMSAAVALAYVLNAAHTALGSTRLAAASFPSGFVNSSGFENLQHCSEAPTNATPIMFSSENTIGGLLDQVSGRSGNHSLLALLPAQAANSASASSLATTGVLPFEIIGPMRTRNQSQTLLDQDATVGLLARGASADLAPPHLHSWLLALGQTLAAQPRAPSCHTNTSTDNSSLLDVGAVLCSGKLQALAAVAGLFPRLGVSQLWAAWPPELPAAGGGDLWLVIGIAPPPSSAALAVTLNGQVCSSPQALSPPAYVAAAVNSSVQAAAEQAASLFCAPHNAQCGAAVQRVVWLRCSPPAGVAPIVHVALQLARDLPTVSSSQLALSYEAAQLRYIASSDTSAVPVGVSGGGVLLTARAGQAVPVYVSGIPLASGTVPSNGDTTLLSLMRCRFGGLQVQTAQVLNDTHVQCTAPALLTGNTSLEVSNDGGQRWNGGVTIRFRSIQWPVAGNASVLPTGGLATEGCGGGVPCGDNGTPVHYTAQQVPAVFRVLVALDDLTWGVSAAVLKSVAEAAVLHIKQNTSLLPFTSIQIIPLQLTALQAASASAFVGAVAAALDVAVAAGTPADVVLASPGSGIAQGVADAFRNAAVQGLDIPLVLGTVDPPVQLTGGGAYPGLVCVAPTLANFGVDLSGLLLVGAAVSRGVLGDSAVDIAQESVLAPLSGVLGGVHVYADPQDAHSSAEAVAVLNELRAADVPSSLQPLGCAGGVTDVTRQLQQGMTAAADAHWKGAVLLPNRNCSGATVLAAAAAAGWANSSAMPYTAVASSERLLSSLLNAVQQPNGLIGTLALDILPMVNCSALHFNVSIAQLAFCGEWASSSAGHSAVGAQAAELLFDGVQLIAAGFAQLMSQGLFRSASAGTILAPAARSSTLQGASGVLAFAASGARFVPSVGIIAMAQSQLLPVGASTVFGRQLLVPLQAVPTLPGAVAEYDTPSELRSLFLIRTANIPSAIVPEVARLVAASVGLQAAALASTGVLCSETGSPSTATCTSAKLDVLDVGGSATQAGLNGTAVVQRVQAWWGGGTGPGAPGGQPLQAILGVRYSAVVPPLAAAARRGFVSGGEARRDGGVVVLSASATSPALSATSVSSLGEVEPAFPNFVRVVPLDTEQAHAFRLLLARFGWAHCAVLGVQGDAYAEGLVQALAEQLNSSASGAVRLLPPAAVMVPAALTRAHLGQGAATGAFQAAVAQIAQQYMAPLKASGTRVVLVAATSSDAEVLLPAAAQAGMTGAAGYLWLHTDSIAQRAVALAATSPGALQVISGSVGVALAAAAGPSQEASLLEALRDTAQRCGEQGGVLPHVRFTGAGGGPTSSDTAAAVAAGCAALAAQLGSSGAPLQDGAVSAFDFYMHDAAVLLGAALTQGIQQRLSFPTASSALVPLLTSVVPVGVTGVVSLFPSTRSRSAVAYVGLNFQQAAAAHGVAASLVASSFGRITNAGDLSITACPPGTSLQRSADGNVLCSECEVDSYKTGFGNGRCTLCPTLPSGARMTTGGLRGGTTLSQCQCPSVFFVSASASWNDTSLVPLSVGRSDGALLSTAGSPLSQCDLPGGRVTAGATCSFQPLQAMVLPPVPVGSPPHTSTTDVFTCSHIASAATAQSNKGPQTPAAAAASCVSFPVGIAPDSITRSTGSATGDSGSDRGVQGGGSLSVAQLAVEAGFYRAHSGACAVVACRNIKNCPRGRAPLPLCRVANDARGSALVALLPQCAEDTQWFATPQDVRAAVLGVYSSATPLDPLSAAANSGLTYAQRQELQRLAVPEGVLLNASSFASMSVSMIQGGVDPGTAPPIAKMATWDFDGLRWVNAEITLQVRGPDMGEAAPVDGGAAPVEGSLSTAGRRMQTAASTSAELQVALQVVSTCTGATDGPMCDSCSAGYTSDGSGGCSKCASLPVLIAGAVFAATLLGASIWLLARTAVGIPSRQDMRRQVAWRLFVDWIQVQGLVMSVVVIGGITAASNAARSTGGGSSEADAPAGFVPAEYFQNSSAATNDGDSGWDSTTSSGGFFTGGDGALKVVSDVMAVESYAQIAQLVSGVLTSVGPACLLENGDGPAWLQFNLVRVTTLLPVVLLVIAVVIGALDSFAMTFGGASVIWRDVAFSVRRNANTIGVECNFAARHLRDWWAMKCDSCSASRSARAGVMYSQRSQARQDALRMARLGMRSQPDHTRVEPSVVLWPRAPFEHWVDIIALISVIALYIVYPSMVTGLLSSFVCLVIPDGAGRALSVLTVETAVSCGGATHDAISQWTAVALAMYILGFPLLVMTLLYTLRRSLYMLDPLAVGTVDESLTPNTVPLERVLSLLRAMMQRLAVAPPRLNREDVLRPEVFHAMVEVMLNVPLPSNSARGGLDGQDSSAREAGEHLKSRMGRPDAIKAGTAPKSRRRTMVAAAMEGSAQGTGPMRSSRAPSAVPQVRPMGGGAPRPTHAHKSLSKHFGQEVLPGMYSPSQPRRGETFKHSSERRKALQRDALKAACVVSDVPEEFIDTVLDVLLFLRDGAEQSGRPTGRVPGYGDMRTRLLGHPAVPGTEHGGVGKDGFGGLDVTLFDVICAAQRLPGSERDSLQEGVDYISRVVKRRLDALRIVRAAHEQMMWEEQGGGAGEGKGGYGAASNEDCKGGVGSATLRRGTRRGSAYPDGDRPRNASTSSTMSLRYMRNAGPGEGGSQRPSLSTGLRVEADHFANSLANFDFSPQGTRTLGAELRNLMMSSPRRGTRGTTKKSALWDTPGLAGSMRTMNTKPSTAEHNIDNLPGRTRRSSTEVGARPVSLRIQGTQQGGAGDSKGGPISPRRLEAPNLSPNSRGHNHTDSGSDSGMDSGTAGSFVDSSRRGSLEGMEGVGTRAQGRGRSSTTAGRMVTPCRDEARSAVPPRQRGGGSPGTPGASPTPGERETTVTPGGSRPRLTRRSSVSELLSPLGSGLTGQLGLDGVLSTVQAEEQAEAAAAQRERNKKLPRGSLVEWGGSPASAAGSSITNGTGTSTARPSGREGGGPPSAGGPRTRRPLFRAASFTSRSSRMWKLPPLEVEPPAPAQGGGAPAQGEGVPSPRTQQLGTRGARATEMSAKSPRGGTGIRFDMDTGGSGGPVAERKNTPNRRATGRQSTWGGRNAMVIDSTDQVMPSDLGGVQGLSDDEGVGGTAMDDIELDFLFAAWESVLQQLEQVTAVRVRWGFFYRHYTPSTAWYWGALTLLWKALIATVTTVVNSDATLIGNSISRDLLLTVVPGVFTSTAPGALQLVGLRSLLLLLLLSAMVSGISLKRPFVEVPVGSNERAKRRALATVQQTKLYAGSGGARNTEAVGDRGKKPSAAKAAGLAASMRTVGGIRQARGGVSSRKLKIGDMGLSRRTVRSDTASSLMSTVTMASSLTAASEGAEEGIWGARLGSSASAGCCGCCRRVTPRDVYHALARSSSNFRMELALTSTIVTLVLGNLYLNMVLRDANASVTSGGSGAAFWLVGEDASSAVAVRYAMFVMFLLTAVFLVMPYIHFMMIYRTLFALTWGCCGLLRTSSASGDEEHSTNKGACATILTKLKRAASCACCKAPKPASAAGSSARTATRQTSPSLRPAISSVGNSVLGLGRSASTAQRADTGSVEMTPVTLGDGGSTVIPPSTPQDTSKHNPLAVARSRELGSASSSGKTPPPPPQRNSNTPPPAPPASRTGVVSVRSPLASLASVGAAGDAPVRRPTATGGEGGSPRLRARTREHVPSGTGGSARFSFVFKDAGEALDSVGEGGAGVLNPLRVAMEGGGAASPGAPRGEGQRHVMRTQSAKPAEGAVAGDSSNSDSSTSPAPAKLQGVRGGWGVSPPRVPLGAPQSDASPVLSLADGSTSDTGAGSVELPVEGPLSREEGVPNMALQAMQTMSTRIKGDDEQAVVRIAPEQVRRTTPKGPPRLPGSSAAPYVPPSSNAGSQPSRKPAGGVFTFKLKHSFEVEDGAEESSANFAGMSSGEEAAAAAGGGGALSATGMSRAAVAMKMGVRRQSIRGGGMGGSRRMTGYMS